MNTLAFPASWLPPSPLAPSAVVAVSHDRVVTVERGKVVTCDVELPNELSAMVLEWARLGDA